jgi:hypothetical protein
LLQKGELSNREIEAGAMPVAYQLAGLPALKANYAGLIALTQSGAWGWLAFSHRSSNWPA